jgi:hypothetical protein
MTIFPTKVSMYVTSLLTFGFFSFVTIRSKSWWRGFGTLVLLVVVVRMFLLGILGFIFIEISPYHSTFFSTSLT